MIRSGRSDRFRWVAAIFATLILAVAFAFGAAEKLGLRVLSGGTLCIVCHCARLPITGKLPGRRYAAHETCRSSCRRPS
jgi:hypothetical protein